LVATAQSRWQPSSCEDEVRSFSGQYDQTSSLFSCCGGCGAGTAHHRHHLAAWKAHLQPVQDQAIAIPETELVYLDQERGVRGHSVHRAAGEGTAAAIDVNATKRS